MAITFADFIKSNYYRKRKISINDLVRPIGTTPHSKIHPGYVHQNLPYIASLSEISLPDRDAIQIKLFSLSFLTQSTGNANLPSKEWKEMDILLDKNQLIYNCIICPFQEAGIIIKKVHYLFTYTGLIVVLRTDSSAVCDKDIRISLQHGYPYLDDYYVAETF